MALSELLKSGVTTITDLSVSRPGWLDDLAASGIRAVVAPMMRQGHWFTKNGHAVEYAWDEKAGEKAFEASMKTIDEAAKHPSGRVSGMVGPAQIDTCREGFFKEALQEATAVALSRFRSVPQDHNVYYLNQTLRRVDPLNGGVWTRLHL